MAISKQPPPRGPLLDPSLTRPDWVAGVVRPESALWLDKNENLDPTLLSFTTDLFRSLDPTLLCTYPESAELYKKLARWVGVDPMQLLLTAGSDGAIRSVFQAYVDVGDVVLHTAPTFAMYPVYSKMYGANAIAFEYGRIENEPYLDFDRFLNVIEERRPRLVCLPNPDSPTGTTLTNDQILRLLKVSSSAGSLLLIDEAYHPFHEESVVSKISEFPHLVVARTFAKAWGLAGLRIGYLVASPEATAYLHKVRPMYEVNTVAVGMMSAMLDHSDVMHASVARLKAGKNAFLSVMDSLGFKTLRGEGNFLHVDFGVHRSAVCSALAGQVLFREDFREPCLKGFSRFSSTTPELFKPVIDLIRSTVHASKGVSP